MIKCLLQNAAHIGLLNTVFSLLAEYAPINAQQSNFRNKFSL